jgi:site-specific recombinase
MKELHIPLKKIKIYYRVQNIYTYCKIIFYNVIYLGIFLFFSSIFRGYIDEKLEVRIH